MIELSAFFMCFSYISTLTDASATQASDASISRAWRLAIMRNDSLAHVTCTACNHDNLADFFVASEWFKRLMVISEDTLPQTSVKVPM